MCGRYSFVPKSQQRKALETRVQVPTELRLSFNIAPTQTAYVIANDQPAHLQQMEWGLIPHWSADGKNSGKLINARSEGIDEKPSFREPIHSKRCLVPADSFYEWRKIAGGQKHPYRIFLENGEMLYLAGIWSEWEKGDKPKRTFAIITTSPNREMSELHDRMPVILPDAESQRLWLSDTPIDEVLSLLHPPPDGFLSMYQISERVNKPGNEGEDLHAPTNSDSLLCSE